MPNFTIPAGHELVTFTGTKLIPQPPLTVTTWFGGRKTIPRPPKTNEVVETTFPDYDLPNYDTFTADFRGEFELIGVYLFTSTFVHRNPDTFAVAYCQLLDRDGEEWHVTHLRLIIESALAAPVMRRYETWHKPSGKTATKTDVKATLVFPSRESLQESVRILEPGDSVVVAKLAPS